MLAVISFARPSVYSSERPRGWAGGQRAGRSRRSGDRPRVEKEKRWIGQEEARVRTRMNFAGVGVAPGSLRCHDDPSQLANHPGARPIHLGGACRPNDRPTPRRPTVNPLRRSAVRRAREIGSRKLKRDRADVNLQMKQSVNNASGGCIAKYKDRCVEDSKTKEKRQRS